MGSLYDRGPLAKPRALVLLCVVLVVGLHRSHFLTDALAVSDAVAPRLATAQCALRVDVGRIPGTAMPPEWAASGARLSFRLEVEFAAEACTDYGMTKERLLLGTAAMSKNAVPTPAAALRTLEPLAEPTFVDVTGQRGIKVTAGAYACDLKEPRAQLHGLKFFLDFPEGAVRNDVELPAERIFFITQCWVRDDNSFRRAQERYDALKGRFNGIQRELADLQAESQSKGFLGKAMILRQTTLLVEKRREIAGQLGELEQIYPLEETTQKGLLAGPNDLLFSKSGVIAVKRFRGALETREQYHFVGTFSFEEFFEDLDEEDAENSFAPDRIR